MFSVTICKPVANHFRIAIRFSMSMLLLQLGYDSQFNQLKKIKECCAQLVRCSFQEAFATSSLKLLNLFNSTYVGFDGFFWGLCPFAKGRYIPNREGEATKSRAQGKGTPARQNTGPIFFLSLCFFILSPIYQRLIWGLFRIFRGWLRLYLGLVPGLFKASLGPM